MAFRRTRVENAVHTAAHANRAMLVRRLGLAGGSLDAA